MQTSPLLRISNPVSARPGPPQPCRGEFIRQCTVDPTPNSLRQRPGVRLKSYPPCLSPHPRGQQPHRQANEFAPTGIALILPACIADKSAPTNQQAGQPERPGPAAAL